MSLSFWPKPKSTESSRPPEEGNTVPDATPIEPESAPSTRWSVFKWIFFSAVFIYVLLSYFHGPILTRLGEYLVVQHPLAKSDLIVCAAGGDVERGMASADLYARGLAPRIFIARETLPDGLDTLKQKGIAYPESIDRVTMIFRGMGVPESAVIRNDQPAESTFQEAERVAAFIKNQEIPLPYPGHLSHPFEARLPDLQEGDSGPGCPHPRDAHALFQIQGGRLVEDAEIRPRSHHGVSEADLLQNEGIALTLFFFHGEGTVPVGRGRV